MNRDPEMSKDRTSAVVFVLFFCSGFSSLIYQVIWLRMAFAHFGVVTPVLSVVLSVFMLGLGAGSLLAGRWGAWLAARLRVSPSVLYGAAELMIGLGAFAVPALFVLGESALLGTGAASSSRYLALSAIVIGAAILPWCILMGATFPLMMAYVRLRNPMDTRSFSFLYLANVIGAMCGTLASALVLIELLGFTRTSMVAAGVNAAIAATSFLLRRVTAPYNNALGRAAAMAAPAPNGPAVSRARWILLVLFVTGFCSLAMEVVWVRAFTIVLQTTIYAFASILATYLLATWVGSALYRRSVRRLRVPDDGKLLAFAGACALLPVALNDPRIHVLLIMVLQGLHVSSYAQFGTVGIVVVLASIVPFCAALGYLTPKLVDDYAEGEPRRAGWCYAINILGGILGPLAAGYIIVPMMDVRFALAVLALPIVVLACRSIWRADGISALTRVRQAFPMMLLLFAPAVNRSYEEYRFDNAPHEIHRDHVATAIAYGTGMDKHLLVNGVGITALTPITKIMAHLPLAVHGHPRDVLVICFGMGTTLRSAASWGVDVTAVDLTQSVIDSFGFFHADAASIAANPKVHILADDGRRFLMRTDRMFDVIMIDPPPPVEAAGSSLLYSTGFYEAAKRKLRTGGILQQWIPGDSEPRILEAVAKSLAAAFPHVVAYRSIENWGYHFLASMQPVPGIEPAEMVARMPDTARRDLIEWGPMKSAAEMATAILARQTPLSELAAGRGPVPAITDDQPYNEYFLLRRYVLK